MKQERTISFTQFEFGIMSKAFDNFTAAHYKKDRDQALLAIKNFTIGMLNIKGLVIPKYFRIITISKNYDTIRDEVQYFITYIGDFT